jgi:hypothetical protein
MNHDEIIELLGAYALDAVDPDEAAAVARHLAECPRCAAEVDEHRAAAALLGHRGGDAPEGVWDAVAARIGTEAAPSPPPGPVLLSGARPAGGTPAGRRRSWRVMVPALAAAAAAVIALLAVQVSHLDGRVARLNALAAHQGMPALAEAALADPHAQRVALVLAGGHHQVAGDLVILPDGSAFLVEGDLPPLPAGRTYQLWSMSGGQAVSLGLLGRDPHVVAFDLGTAAPVTAFAVTAEPAGGVVVATSAPVAQGSIGA